MSGLPFASDVWPFFFGVLLLFGLPGLLCLFFKFRRSALTLFILAILAGAYMLFFFRDPERIPPADPDIVLAGADGRVMAVTTAANEHIGDSAVRISIFLSLLDVHVNRAPIPGKVTELAYHPGKRYFTFQEKSSQYNQHSTIMIEGERTRCLVKQIVGPVARRVVYWLELGQMLKAGDRIGMMKFGSRLDMFLPADDVEVLVQPGEFVRAGLTPVARLRKQPASK